MKTRITRRRFLQVAAGTAAAALASACGTAPTSAPTVAPTKAPVGAAPTATTAAVAPTATKAATAAPTATLAAKVAKDTYMRWNADDYLKTGKKIDKFNEAPTLAELVKQGKLPPVEKRLPEDYLVVQPREKIGVYGGTLNGYGKNPTSFGNDNWSMFCRRFFAIDNTWSVMYPDVIKSFEWSSDFTTLTVHMRKGMRWSDGELFTADDIMFWWNDMMLNKQLSPNVDSKWVAGGKPMEVTKVDDLTVTFKFAVPYPSFMEQAATMYTFAPKHYLKKWHPTYNPQAEEVAKAEGFKDWWTCFKSHDLYSTHIDQQLDPNCPSLDVVILTKIDQFGNKYYERNPYFWQVDTAGNQLPYVDGFVRYLVGDVQTVILKFQKGELDFGTQQFALEHAPILKQNEAQGNYTTYLWPGVMGADRRFILNLTVTDTVLRPIFNDVRFRQALSLAINRDEINKTLYFGLGMPRQFTVPDSVSFYEDWMGKHYAEYDPKKANDLLDQMGLKLDPATKIRLRPDGKPLQIVFEDGTASSNEKMNALVKEYWKAIGVDVTFTVEARDLFQQRSVANSIQASVWFGDSVDTFVLHRDPFNFRAPFSLDTMMQSGGPWRTWLKTGGKQGEEPPAEIKELQQLADAFSRTLTGSPEYNKAGKEMVTKATQGLYCIGSVGQVPAVVVANNRVVNFSKTNPCLFQNFYGEHMEQLFIQK